MPEARSNGLRSPAPETLLSMPITLPIAIHKAGTLLTEFSITQSGQDLTSLYMSQTDQLELRAAMQELRSFHFLPGYNLMFQQKPRRSEADMQYLIKYLKSVVDTDTLKDLSLYFDSQWTRSRLDYDMGALLSFRSWPELRSLYTDSMSVSLETIQKFTEQLREDVPSLSLTSTRLLNGTWAEVLDTLRTKANPGWHLFDAHGGECHNLSNDEHYKIFVAANRGFYDPTDNLADQFIHGKIGESPLRKTQA